MFYITGRCFSHMCVLRAFLDVHWCEWTFAKIFFFPFLLLFAKILTLENYPLTLNLTVSQLLSVVVIVILVLELLKHFEKLQFKLRFFFFHMSLSPSHVGIIFNVSGASFRLD